MTHDEPSDTTRHGVETETETTDDPDPSPTRGRRVRRRRKAVRAKRARRRKRRVIAAATLSIVVGLTSLVGSIFFASVELPHDLDDRLDQHSTVYYSDGETEMGTIGAKQRTSIPLSTIPEHLQWAVIATEDKDFYEHDGVDFWGVMRALWNNVSGGKTQGASTLTQQYVGQVAKIRGDDSYLRKAREAVMAMKMEDRYSKKSILNHYLNLIYFGRGAYGVEAASRAFFAKPAEDLTASESALLAAQIKSPSGRYDPRDPLGRGERKATREATERWSYVLDQMVEVGKLSRADRAKLTELPETVGLDTRTGSGRDDPTGFVSHTLVLKELRNAGITAEEAMRGGYHITTSIDHSLQDAAESAAKLAYEDKKDAATVAVEAKTGRVMAYYGGRDGTHADQAGDGMPHPPGASFNVVTAIAAMENGKPIDSTWNGESPRRFDGRDKPVVNVGGVSKPKVTLAEAVLDKLNTPMYAIAEAVGPEKLAAVAGRLGVDRLREPAYHDGDPRTIDTDDTSADWDPDLGLGAYPMSVMDSAGMYATVAGGGIHREPHVIDEVTDSVGDSVYTPKPESSRAVDEYTAVTVSGVLSGGILSYPAAAEAGTKILATNGSATWHSGFADGIAVSVWAGDDKQEGDGSSLEDTLAESIWSRIIKESLGPGTPDPTDTPTEDGPNREQEN